jgi:hypothetical protein
MSRKNGGIIGPANTPVGGLITGLAGGVWRMNDVANFVGNSQWPKVPENIDNSLRFDDGSTDYLRRTPSSAGNRRTFTFSTWIKRSALGSINRSIICANVDTANKTMLRFTDSDEIRFVRFTTGGATNQLITNAKFRDVSAWYHIVLAVDTTNSTAGDRLRLYVNGSEITSFSTESQPTQNYDYDINNTEEHNIGLGTDTDTHLFDGYMAEVVLIDGQQLDPTSFGEFDTTTGIWKPKKIGQIANAGTNSFYLDFKDSSNVGKDASGLSNNFTVNNLTSVDQGTDTCVVNYATMNSLAVPPSNAPTFAEGNLKISTNNSNANPVISTMGVSQGKWYAEAKRISYDGGSGADDGFRIGFGVTYVQDVNLVPAGIADSGHYFMIGNGIVYNGSTDLGDKAGDSNVSDDGVVGIALDLDNNRISWSFNGAWMTGSGAWSGSSPSSYVDIASGYTYFFLQTDGSNGRAYTAGWNFGGQSAFTISSGNSDANGFGNFEYPVPSGYYALNTSNLNTYG